MGGRSCWGQEVDVLCLAFILTLTNDWRFQKDVHSEAGTEGLFVYLFVCFID